jgi:hypothetical protein
MALLLLAALALPARATAAVTIGQLPPDPPAAMCTGAADYLQPSVTGGPLYVAREAGTITSWSTNSASAGATYTLKIFRRTSDPDAFQVVAHTTPHVLSAGTNTVPVDVQVESGDLIGFHVSGPANSCTFSLTDDTVLKAPFDLADGSSAPFTPVTDVRLNLAANLVPSNSFAFAGLTRDSHRGTATLTVEVPNPGTVGLTGRGLKKPQSKSVPVPGSLLFPIAARGKLKRRLAHKGRATLHVNATFSPPGGDPSTQTIAVTLRQRRPAPLP